ncbi:MAG: hypothetical protein GY862_12245 [Gammaproteobacteria bacterium]|nr:hypothetical protein [Gammaproteobacteria bacterium]
MTDYELHGTTSTGDPLRFNYIIEQQKKKIERLQAELKNAIVWQHLPKLPETEPGCRYIWVAGCVIHNREKVGAWEEMKTVCYDSQHKRFFIHIGGGDEKDVDVRAWYYEPQSAPPKPEGEIDESEAG